jgi:hypothetical protein
LISDRLACDRPRLPRPKRLFSYYRAGLSSQHRSQTLNERENHIGMMSPANLRPNR